MVTLKYKDETDRAYGLSGMSVCMCMMENERFIDSVNLDSEPDKGLAFTSDFFYPHNQSLSAKTLWNDSFNHFRLLTGLLLSNVMCRAMVRNREELTREMNELLLKNLFEEGHEECSLEDDEIRMVYNESFAFFHRVFAHPDVSVLVSRFVDNLTERRSLDGEDVVRLLRPLLH